MFLDLLEHEIVVAALFCRGQIPMDVKRSPPRHAAGEIGDLIAVPAYRHHLILAELDGVAGVVDECRDVGGDEMLTVAHPEHQRGGAARCNHHVRLIGMRDDQRERTLQPAAHHPDGLR